MNKASHVYQKINNIPTSQAIDMLAQEWINRKPPKGIRKEKALIVFEKGAGILDKAQDTMAADIWTPDEKKLLPRIKKIIMENILSYIPKKSIKQVVVIGSLTGLQYKGTSDLDVNIVLDPPELVEKFWEARRSKNEKIITGTKHSLNVYLQGYQGEIPGYQDSYFGVYDVLNNKWLVKPPPKSSYRLPKDKFRTELISIKMHANEFMRRVDNYERSLKNKKKVSSIWNVVVTNRRVKRDLEQLFLFLDELQEGRTFAYSWGWGIPRVGYRNVLYKFLHKWLPFKYQSILEKIEEIKYKSK